MKEFLQSIFKSFQTEKIVEKIVYVEKPIPIILKTNREKLLDIAVASLGIDPTPKDEVDDEVSCVFSLITIMRKLYPDFPILTYTPNFLKQLRSDKRFKETTEFKEGNIIISVTATGNGKVMGHTGCLAKNGKILSNSSSTGLWSDKFDNITWIQRYCIEGQLLTYLFEPI
jgi:hypothetical protein